MSRAGRRIVLWRHGRTAWNVDRRGQGQTDVPLDSVGEEQARAAAARLASLRPSMLVSSDLSRASGTAATLAALTGLEVRLDRGLREIHLGAWQGLTRAEADKADPESRRRLLAGEDIRRGGDGETMAEVADRVAAAVSRVAERMSAGETAVVVSHGVAIRVGTCRFLGLPQEHWEILGGLSNCSWVVLEEGSPGWRLTEWNAGSLPEPVLSDELPAEAG